MIPIGITAMLCLGTVSAWSIFRTPLEQELGLGATASLLPFTVALVCYAGMMPLAGRWISRGYGRRVATTGALVVALGYLLASATGSIQELVLAYGVVTGLGVGLVYGVPLALVASWFPERNGLAAGLTVTGFRLSPLIAASSTRPTLRLFGLLFSAILLLAAWLLRPASASTAPPAAAVAAAVAAGQHHRSPRLVFLGLWLTYALGTLAGLRAIGIASPVGIELIGVPPALAAASVSLFAVFNGLSRPLICWPCDR